MDIFRTTKKQSNEGSAQRHEIYQTIHYDVSHVQRNIALVLNGEEPLKLEKLKFEPLMLLPVKE